MLQQMTSCATTAQGKSEHDAKKCTQKYFTVLDKKWKAADTRWEHGYIDTHRLRNKTWQHAKQQENKWADKNSISNFYLQLL